MSMTAEEKKLLQETHDTVIELSTTLLGIPNTDDTGLVGEVKQLKVNQRKLTTRFWILVVALASSGIIGGSLVRLLGN